MDINNTLVKLMKNDDQDSESGQSDIVPAKSTNKVIKSFIKCVSALVLHVENVLSNSNGHFITYNSSQINSNHDNDIDIVEHAIKEDPDDASRYLRSIKKYMLQLCLLCVEQNIYVNYDLKFYKIDYYSCLDDSTRSLVINYLTENVVYMIEHIGFIISMFTQEKYLEEAKDIRKSLQKIYKQILLIPLNSNLDETPKVCQNLNSSQWYSESIQSLGEKLSQLRTALIKFKKVFKKKILEQDNSTEDGSIYNISSPGKRKISNISDEPVTKRLKQERNKGMSPDHEFLVPQVPPVQKNHPENENNDVRAKKKSEKQKNNHENNENDVISDTESVKKKKKHKNNSENSENETIIILENDKKKKKRKSMLENSDNESKFSESNSEIIEKKNKHKSKSENNLVLSVNNSENIKNKFKTKSGNYENESILISDTEKKIKRRCKSKNRENHSDIDENNLQNIKNKSNTEPKSDVNDLIIIENESEGIKKKKKRRSNLENEENNSIINLTISKNVKNKSKTEEKSDVNDLIIIENESAGMKKKKKHRSNLENEENNSIINLTISKNVKNKSKTEEKSDVNDLIIIENESAGMKKKKKRRSKSENMENNSIVNLTISKNGKNKSNIELENGENDLIIIENDSENIKKKNKRRSKSENKENNSVDNKSVSENVNNKSNTEPENAENDLIIVENDSEYIKENKRRSKSKSRENNSVVKKSISENVKIKSKTVVENGENVSIILESDSENITKKNKRRSKSENSENNAIVNLTISKNGKNKSKTEAENAESDSIILESDSEDMKKKNKRRSKSENRENNSVVNKCISENVKTKSKTAAENDENDSIILESDSENITKKNKQGSKSENREIHSIVNLAVSKNGKNKSKTETENAENDSVILESDSENIIKKNKQGSKSENRENDSDVSDNDSESIKKKKSHESKCVKNKNNSKMTDNSTDAENCDKTQANRKSQNKNESVGELFSDNDNSLDQNKENTLVLKTKNKSKNVTHEDDSDDVFNAIYRGEMETAEVGNAEDFFQLIAREENLSEEEKFLYIQELLLEAKQSNELSPKMKEKLKNLSVLIDWEVPLIHKVEKWLTKGPSHEEQEILNSLGVSNKQYNLDEDAIIRKNWEDFCKLHDLDANPKPFLMLKHGKEAFLKYEDRKKFVQFLGKGLPHRALNSIYRRFKLLYRDKNKLGRFTPQEDDLILTYCNKAQNGKNKFADLANILNRTRPTIEARYRSLTQLYRDRVHWNTKLDEELINALLKTIKSKNVEDLRNIKLTGDHYKKVADEMKIFWEKVRHHWLKHTYTKLFSSIPLHLGKIRLKIVQILIDSEVKDWKKIDWNDVESHFEGITKEFLMVQMGGVQVMAPKRFRSDLGAVLKHSKEYLDTMKDKESAFGKTLLKRYKMLKDGSIQPYE